MLATRKKQVLLIAELSATAEPQPSTLAAVTFVRKLCRRIDADWYLFAATSEARAVESSIRQLGATVLFCCPIEASLHPLTEHHAPSICRLVRDHPFDYVVAAATSFGKDLLPHIAGVFDAAYVGDCTGIRETAAGVTFRRPVHAGVATAHCEPKSRLVVVTVRPTEFERASPDQPICPIVAADCVAPTTSRIKCLSFETTGTERPRLSEARVVVAGGRALGSRFFEVLGPLADTCGAALGATRAECDTGHVPGDLQVGQTGKIVAPDLYFAIGISGSVQHVAGMRGSRTIVAINSDPRAPVFSYADFGLVGDLWQLVPELVAAIRRRQSTPNP